MSGSAAAGVGLPDRFVPLRDETRTRVQRDSAWADAGDASEPNHRHARQTRGVRSSIPATSGRPTTKPPSGRDRRLLKQRLHKKYGP